MKSKFAAVVTAGVFSGLFVVNCTTVKSSVSDHESGESVVFIGEQPAALACLPAPGVPVNVRSTYLPSADTVEYVEGRDFVVDYANGTLSRTPQSAMPDFRTNSLYGQRDFDQTQFPGYGNERFFAYVDYSLVTSMVWPAQTSQARFLVRTQQKLKSGGKLKIVAFGDSITAGLNVSTPTNLFWMRWVDDLKHQYPQAQITALNRATPGDTSAQGLERLKTKVLNEHPDLVLIGFGMNDNNIGKFGVPVGEFEHNLETIVTRIRQETSAEVILYSAFPPNPEWKFGSRHMENYATATKHVADRLSCAYADVFDNWQMLARRKKPEDLLANDINHPNDFGHWIYYRVFCSIGLTDNHRTALTKTPISL
jgi:lysophospholipase L1-like esterase